MVEEIDFKLHLSRDRPNLLKSVKIATMGEGPSFSEFFASQPKPPRLEEHLENVLQFVTKNLNNGKRVVLVTVRCYSALPPIKSPRFRTTFSPSQHYRQSSSQAGLAARGARVSVEQNPRAISILQDQN